MCYSGVGSENGGMPDRANSFQRPNNFGRHAGELMPFGFKPDFMHHWNLPQAYNPYATSCSRVPGSTHAFEPLPTYGEESTSSHEVVSKEESSNSPTDRLVLSTLFCVIVSYHLFTGWPLTWKTWKSQGIPKWSGKSRGKWKKSGKLKFASDFERAEELKLQLLAVCGPGLWICSSLALG